MTDDELRSLARRLKVPRYMYDTDDGLAALRAVFEAGASSGEVIAKHSGKVRCREWHTVSTWLYPGDQIILRAGPLAKAGKGEG